MRVLVHAKVNVEEARGVGTTIAPGGAMPRLAPSVAVAFVLSGCTFSSQFTPLREPPHPPVPRNPAEVEIFSSSAPRRPHVDVGLIVAPVIGGWGAMIQALRVAAAERGCDAVTLGGPWGSTCIMYTAPAQAPAATPCVTATPASPPPAPPRSADVTRM